MTASLSNEVPTPRRVVSVSPHPHTAENPMQGNDPAAGSVVHDRAHDASHEPCATSAPEVTNVVLTHALWQEARRLLANIDEAESRANGACAHLQERLRLCARMLRAFESQIARIDKALAACDERVQIVNSARNMLTEQLTTIESCADVFERRLGAQFKNLIQIAAARFEHAALNQPTRLLENSTTHQSPRHAFR